MAVIVKYIVVRNGVEKMTFATKKEADIHDKMLDIADTLYEFLEREDIGLDEIKMEAVSLALARDREKIISVLRGIKPKKSSPAPKIIKPGKSKVTLNKADIKAAPLVSKMAKAKTSSNRKTAPSKKVS